MKEYHAINILEGIYEDYVKDNDKEYMEKNLAFAEAVKALTEIQRYRAIGTVDEFQELRGIHKAKKPNKRYKTRYIWDSAYCPVCNCGITSRWNFCQGCGQAIDWNKKD